MGPQNSQLSIELGNSIPPAVGRTQSLTSEPPPPSASWRRPAVHITTELRVFCLQGPNPSSISSDTQALLAASLRHQRSPAAPCHMRRSPGTLRLRDRSQTSAASSSLLTLMSQPQSDTR